MLRYSSGCYVLNCTVNRSILTSTLNGESNQLHARTAFNLCPYHLSNILTDPQIHCTHFGKHQTNTLLKGM